MTLFSELSEREIDYYILFINNERVFGATNVKTFSQLKTYLIGASSSTATVVLNKIEHRMGDKYYNFTAVYTAMLSNRIRSYANNITLRNILERDRVSNKMRIPAVYTVSVINAATRISLRVLAQLIYSQYMFTTYAEFSNDNIVNAILTHRSLDNSDETTVKIAKAVSIMMPGVGHHIDAQKIKQSLFMLQRIIEIRSTDFIISLLTQYLYLSVRVVAEILKHLTPTMVIKHNKSVNWIITHTLNHSTYYGANGSTVISTKTYMIIHAFVTCCFNPDEELCEMIYKQYHTLRSFVNTHCAHKQLRRLIGAFRSS